MLNRISINSTMYGSSSTSGQVHGICHSQSIQRSADGHRFCVYIKIHLLELQLYLTRAQQSFYQRSVSAILNLKIVAVHIVHQGKRQFLDWKRWVDGAKYLLFGPGNLQALGSPPIKTLPSLPQTENNIKGIPLLRRVETLLSPSSQAQERDRLCSLARSPPAHLEYFLSAHRLRGPTDLWRTTGNQISESLVFIFLFFRFTSCDFGSVLTFLFRVRSDLIVRDSVDFYLDFGCGSQVDFYRVLSFLVPFWIGCY